MQYKTSRFVIDLLPSYSAGLVLAALPHLARLGLSGPTPGQVARALDSGLTTAYKARNEIEAFLATVQRPTGRPPGPVDDTPPTADDELSREILTFIYDHPGCVTGSAIRRTYSQDFHKFIIELCQRESRRRLCDIARSAAMSEATLKEWLKGKLPQVTPEPRLNLTTKVDSPHASHSQIQTILAAWKAWKGGYRPFAEYVQLQLRIPFSRELISDILEANGSRIPKRRRPDADLAALKGGFETFFPGAQWVGDGTQLIVSVNGEHFRVNLELIVDAHTAALTGANIRPTEDSQAVISAVQDSQETTGEKPLALLLDNKASNHCPDVGGAVAPALLMRSRPYTPTDKPHVEGAFGLFAQQTPPLVLNGQTPRELAVQLATLAVMIWGRTLNHKPRAAKDGKSRVDLYAEKPTQEAIDAAKLSLEERLQQQQRLRQTLAQRQDPIKRELIAKAFTELKLDDPDGYLLTSIATFPLDAVLAGIAVYKGKRAAKTLPDDVDARYLLGIIRNTVQEDEGFAIAMELLKSRLLARDRFLCTLDRQRDDIEERLDDEILVPSYIDRALEDQRQLDRYFWLKATADIICDLPDEERQPLLKLAARRIHANRAVPHRRRLAATRFLFSRCIPLH